MQGTSKKRKARTKAQQRWLESVVALGSFQQPFSSALIHHAVGETAKHSKVHVGNWWLVPMTVYEHIILHSHNATFGYVSRKEFEKAAFKWTLETLHDHPDYPPRDVIDAINDYHI